MALAEILAALRAEGDEEIARITTERDVAVADIVKAGREQAKRVEATAATARDAALAADSDVMKHRAELDVERRLQDGREVVFQEVMGLAKDRLARFRHDPAYEVTLQALIDECAAFLGEIAIVEADGRDAELVSAALVNRGGARVDETLECWGGIVARDGNGVIVRNTLEDRLERAEPDLRRRIGRVVPGLIDRSGDGAA